MCLSTRPQMMDDGMIATAGVVVQAGEWNGEQQNKNAKQVVQNLGASHWRFDVCPCLIKQVKVFKLRNEGIFEEWLRSEWFIWLWKIYTNHSVLG